MRCLPFALVRGPLLGGITREARQDTQRNRGCSSCGEQIPVQRDRPDQTVRCPACARWQRITVTEEPPWRLTAASAEAIRRTRRWLRHL